jgi:hypothetical protein
MNFQPDYDNAVSSARILARSTATARLIALAEVSIFGEAFFDEIVDGRVEGIQSAKLFALELGKRRVDTRNPRRHWRSFEDMPTCPTSGYKVC